MSDLSEATSLTTLDHLGQAISIDDAHLLTTVTLVRNHAISESLAIASMVGIVRTSYNTLQQESVRICVTLVRLRDIVGNDGYWSKFCSANFPNMSESAIRAAVRSGKKLIDFQARHPESKPFELLAGLRMSALSALGNAPDELITAVTELAETGVKVSVSTVNDLRIALEETKEREARLAAENLAIQTRAENELTRAKLTATQATLAMQSAQNELADLQKEHDIVLDEIQELESKSKEKLTSSSDGSNSQLLQKEMRELENLKREQQATESRRDVLSQQLLDTKKRLQEAEDALTAAQAESGSIDTLKSDIDSITARWANIFLVDKQLSTGGQNAVTQLADKLQRLVDLLRTKTGVTA